MIYCEYGAECFFFDVTHLILQNFAKDGILCLPVGNKQFNTHFSDPCPGIDKTLMIYLNDRVYAISEHDTCEYTFKVFRKGHSSYHDFFVKNKKHIYDAKTLVLNKDPNYYDLTVLNDLPNPDVSIVMTTYNRSIQTYFTLQTISKSINKSVQVIIIDDSKSDLLDMNVLKNTGLCIYHIKTKNKFWFNPCINYNLGFQFIKGNKIIIQNAEVCHIGDVIDYVDKNLKDNQYFVFDVVSLPNMKNNLIFQNSDISFDNFGNFSKLFGDWYQHHNFYSRQLHFLTAINKQDFDKILGFDYDFCMGSWYDDNELIYRIHSSGIKAIDIPYNKEVMGIHQWHTTSGNDWDKNVIRNEDLFNAKKAYFNQHSKFFYLTDYKIDEADNKIEELFT